MITMRMTALLMMTCYCRLQTRIPSADDDVEAIVKATNDSRGESLKGVRAMLTKRREALQALGGR